MNSRHLWVCLLFFISVGLRVGYGQRSYIPEDSLQVLYAKTFDQVYNYDYSSAIETSGMLIEKAQEEDNNYYISRGYSRLGSIHNALNDTLKSKDYYKKALLYGRRTASDTFIANIYNDLGNVYADNGGDITKAIEYYKKSIDLNEEGKAPPSANLASIMNIGWVYLDQKNPDSAFNYLNRSQLLLKDSNKHPLYHINLNNLYGRYYFQKKDYEKAIPILIKTADSAGEGNYLDAASQANLYLSKAYEEQGNLAAALMRFKQHKVFDDRLSKINREQGLLEASARYKLEQYESDLAAAATEQAYADALFEKKSQQSTIFIIVSCVLLLAFISILLLFTSRKKYINRLNRKNQELIKARDKAEQLSKTKAKFFSTVSHELRTPLYGVIGLSTILLEDKALSAVHKDDLQSLKFSADYLLALINDVLTLNKIDANGIKLERASFSLKKLVDSISRSFAYSLEQNNNQFIVSIDERLPSRFLGDSVKLSQILMNLVGNAVKFNENGIISLRIELIEKPKKNVFTLKFIVEDDGIGIPKEKQAMIFDEFSQVDNKNYNYQGTGLGLPIVKKLLTIFNSEIELESELHQGAKFSFVLNLCEDVGHIQTTFENVNCSTEHEEPINDMKTIHVLIVDDNKINQKITQKILETRHFKCSLADDGEQAIVKARQGTYHLILMDVNMPKIDGIQATKSIREFNTTTPIIALTAVEIQEMKDKILASGMNDIILKPYDVAQFLTTILRYVGASTLQV